MNERTGLVKMKGNPLTLVGNEVKVGDTAPDFEVLNDKLEPVKLSSLQGKGGGPCFSAVSGYARL